MRALVQALSPTIAIIAANDNCRLRLVSNLTSLTLPDNSELTYGYDTAHRRTSVTDLFNNTIQYTLDALGDTTLAGTYNSSHTLYHKHSATFDALGRTLTDVGGAGQTTTFAYDNNGNALTVTDPLSHVTHKTYDALNRLSTSTDPATGVTSYGYYANDIPYGITAPNGTTSYIGTDGFGNITSLQSPDSHYPSFVYDPDNNLTQKTDGSGYVTNYTWDALDRMVTKAFPADASENVTYVYDNAWGISSNGIGRLTGMSDSVGGVTFNYDEQGLLISALRGYGSIHLNTNYSHDRAGRLNGIAYPSGTWVGYSHNAMGQPNGVPFSSSGADSIAIGWPGYFPLGPLSGFGFYNGDDDAYTRDLDWRITNMKTTSAPSYHENLTYGYDAANNVTAVTDAITPANTQALTYDTLNRLSTASGNYGALSYGYDGNNNRTSQTFSGTGTTYGYKGYYIPGGDLLYQGVTGAVTQSIPYTAAGNVAGFSPALPSGITGVNYNKAEQLSNVASGASTVATYAYDGFGRRASKTVSGVTTYYIYAPDGTLLEEANGSGAVQVDYAYLPEYSFLPGNSSYLGLRPIGEYSPVTKHLYYLHTDRLGSPIAATDHAGVTQWQATYQPFGLANITTSAITQDLRLPGQFYDAETGFHHNGAREYMPGGPAGTPGVPGGRYVQMDPLFLAGNRFDAGNPNAVIGGLNPFVYVSANPGIWIDPWGLAETNWFNTGGGRGPLMGPTNGNWGGACWSGGAFSCNGNPMGNAAPADSGDQCYQSHDQCYSNCSIEASACKKGQSESQQSQEQSACINACDANVDQCLSRLPADSRQWPNPPTPGTEGNSEWYRDHAIQLFR